MIGLKQLHSNVQMLLTEDELAEYKKFGLDRLCTPSVPETLSSDIIFGRCLIKDKRRKPDDRFRATKLDNRKF